MFWFFWLILLLIITIITTNIAFFTLVVLYVLPHALNSSFLKNNVLVSLPSTSQQTEALEVAWYAHAHFLSLLTTSLEECEGVNRNKYCTCVPKGLKVNGDLGGGYVCRNRGHQCRRGSCVMSLEGSLSVWHQRIFWETCHNVTF